MANRHYIGGVTTSIAKVDSYALTINGVGAETWTWTITDEGGGTKLLTFLSDATPTTAEVAVGLVAAWAADKYAASLATASGTDTPVVLTAVTAGVPFNVALTASGDDTAAKTVTTANQGPNDYNSYMNWYEGAVPVANDNVFITGSNAISYGLDQSSVELDDFIVMPGCTATIGTANAYLRIDMADADRFEFNGTGRSYIDVGTAAITPIILNSAAVASGQMGLALKGSAIATLDLRKGHVRLVTAAVTTIRQTYMTTQASDTTLEAASDCTLTTYTKTGGTGTLECAATTVTNDAGTLTLEGSGAYTTVTANGGTVYPKASGTITTYNADGGTSDFTRSSIGRTVTTMTRSGDGVVIWDSDVLTLTNKPTGTGPMQLSAA
jgi:hypothetical protein